MPTTTRNRAVSNGARLRSRERRFDPLAILVWQRYLLTSLRTICSFRESGVAIHFGLKLNASHGNFAVAEMFRSVGFVVEADGYEDLIVFGEPCLALSFMSMAARAGKLDPDSAHFLHESTHLQAPHLDKEHAPALHVLSRTLAAIDSVHPPRRSATA